MEKSLSPRRIISLAIPLAVALVALQSGPTARAEQAATACYVGGAKWKLSVFPKRCFLVEDEKRLQEILTLWQWAGPKPITVDWSKQAVIIDGADAPFGNAEAACGAVVAETQPDRVVMNWKWQSRKLTPSSSPDATKDANKKKEGQPIGEAFKESFKQVPGQVVGQGKAIAEDFKKFPSPLPQRQAVISLFPKELVKAGAKVECRVEK